MFRGFTASVPVASAPVPVSSCHAWIYPREAAADKDLCSVRISLDAEVVHLYDSEATEERIVVGRLGGPVMPALRGCEEIAFGPLIPC